MFHPAIRRTIQPVSILTLIGILLFPGPATARTDDPDQKKQDTRKITEEILVVAEAPRERPVSTVTRLDATQIEQVKPLDLSEVIRYAPGVTVTFGNKSIYTLKLRGMDSKRIALLMDGIPVYEPYYSSFDLKNVSAQGIDSLQLTKGPSSVLYGPNTMGGIVNVITQRPTGRPQLSLTGSMGEQNTRSLGLRAGAQMDRLAFTGNYLYQDSDGFYFPSQDGGPRLDRSNSEYTRSNINAKFYYTPNDQSELMVSAAILRSEYAMPPGLMDSKPRYWRFKNWDRNGFNAGGFTSLGGDATARFRAYWIGYDNTLEMFKDAAMSKKRFESTFDNAVYGFFGLTDFGMGRGNRLKLSVNYKADDARLQDDVGEPWEELDQWTFSLAAEDHLTLFDNWQLVGGLSWDTLNKFVGDSTSRINPLIGIKFTPLDELDLHLSLSRKSRFPTMRAMYSSSSGNPDLVSESGSHVELGFTYSKEVFISGAVFMTRFKDMIDSVSIPETNFQKLYFNIDKAHINGFEIQVQKSLAWLAASVNYTFLDHENEGAGRPLDALPEHTLSFDIHLYPVSGLRVGFLGQVAGTSDWFDYYSEELWEIPSYFNLDAVAGYRILGSEVFVKLSNIFDNFIYSEPGYPWRGRFIEVGFKANLFTARD